MTLAEFARVAADNYFPSEWQTVEDYQRAIDAWLLWERGREAEFEF